MSIDVYKSSINASYVIMERVAYYFAVAFSQSSHFNIIDSHSGDGTPGRYKGDPIADGQWVDFNTPDNNNAWFIVESQETIHTDLNLPKWQAKFQFAEGAFSDVSDTTGTLYPKNHGDTRKVFIRFCPWGGWDLEDVEPDFNPTIEGTAPSIVSTNNHGCYLSHGGSGDDTRWYVTTGSGYFLIWNRRNEGAYEPLYFGAFVGDVTPVISGQMNMPRALIATEGDNSLVGVNDSSTLMHEGDEQSDSTADFSNDSCLSGVAFWDNTPARIEEAYRLNSSLYDNGYDLNKHQSNPFTSSHSVVVFEFMPIPVTTGGHWFTVPALRKGPGVGVMPIDGGKWFSTGVPRYGLNTGGYCLYVPWDGSTYP